MYLIYLFASTAMITRNTTTSTEHNCLSSLLLYITRGGYTFYRLNQFSDRDNFSSGILSMSRRQSWLSQVGWRKEDSATGTQWLEWLGMLPKSYNAEYSNPHPSSNKGPRFWKKSVPYINELAIIFGM